LVAHVEVVCRFACRSAFAIDAGKVKSLAVMSDAPAALYPNVPTLKAHRQQTGRSARGAARATAGHFSARRAQLSPRSRRSRGARIHEFMAGRGFA